MPFGHLLEDIAQRFDTSLPTLDDDALKALQCYPFPGNVRELRNILEHATVLSEGRTIYVSHLPEHLSKASLSSVPLQTSHAGSQPVQPAPTGHTAQPFRERIADYEMSLIQQALRDAAGNQTQAALQLQIPRRTLVHKLRHCKTKGE